MAPRGQLAQRVDTDPLKRQIQKLSSITGPTSSNYGEIDTIVRAFAFLLIDHGTSNTASGHARVLRAAFTAARFCIEDAELELALSIMTVVAQRLENLKASTPAIDLEIFQSFVAENFAFRVQLHYLEGHLDLAEHLFGKVPKTYSIKNGETVVQIYYNIGYHAFASFQNDVAIKWLERAATRIDECNEHLKPKRSGFDHLELLVRHTLARIYKSMDTSETKDKMAEQLQILKEKYGGNPAVIFLQLETLRPANEEDKAEFFKGCLAGAMRYLKYGGDLSEDHVLQAFQLLLKHVPLARTDWVDRSFIALVSQALSTSLGEHTKIEVICDAAQILNSRGFETLSEQATHAALAFIWKHISTGFETDYSVAQEWCLIALNTKIFEACSYTNKIQIQKKFVSLGLDGFDAPSARKMLSVIPLHNIIDPQGGFKNDFQVLFLMWRLALLECKGEKPNCTCQQILQNSPPAGHPQRLQFIQACTLEAQRLKKSVEVMKCLHDFIEEVQEGSENPESPSDGFLEREEILFLIYVLSNEVDSGNLAAPVVTLMAHNIILAAYMMQQEAQDDYVAVEQEWVFQKCYALVCILLENSKLEMVEALMKTLKELIIFLQSKETDNPRPEGETTLVDAIGPRYLLLVLILNVCRARSAQADEEAKSHYYEKVRTGLLNLRNSRIFPELDDAMESLLWGLCFEACIHGQEWDMALWAFHNSSQCDGGKMSAQYMETILSKSMPSKYKVWLVREIIRQIYSKDSLDSLLLTPSRSNIPYYLQVLFHLCITARNREETIPSELEFYDDDCLSNVWGKDGAVQMTYFQIAESILDQVIASSFDDDYLQSHEHIQMHCHKDPESDEMSQSECEHYTYPIEELGKLASLSFNQAMDFYAEGRDELCKSWAQRSVNMASLMGDDAGDHLVALFEERLKALF
ncbi:Meiosis specific protein SPO22 [Penicillium pulvis]|uniref:Meiosis specific protein SPO22 n=1 Tax=Penicillium pulvis TaxID=1562058 RepID=UPI00254855ED|nr:Meiosis specific protein SPO22 [Penicillium pulvis]KAJ5785015.1 Meiosis specific protein SPO22 [Penicillium pulvis]